MRLIVAECVARYTGRGDTYLPSGVRMILLKNDGSLSIHGESGNKPLNYMSAKAKVEFIRSLNPLTGTELLTIIGETTTEVLTITCTRVFQDSQHELTSPEPGLLRDNTEAHLQLWLVENLAMLDGSLSNPKREFETGAGPVDIAAYRSEQIVPIEVKRVATTPAIRQVLRYAEALTEGGHADVEPMVIAVKIMPKARALAAKKGVAVVALNEVLPLGYSMEFSDNIAGALVEEPQVVSVPV